MKKYSQLLLSAAITGALAIATVNAAECRINLALAANGAIASQKDDPFGMPASKGNDGNIVANADFAHTGNADNEWWEVNLGAPKSIAEVRVWLRSDQYDQNLAPRDSNLRLVIYNNAAHTTEVYSQSFDGSGITLPYRNITLTLPAMVTGQVVRIEHPLGVANYLQINEVQVFNQTVEEVDLARTGYASLSSTYSTYDAARAIDGVNVGTAGGGATGSTAHSGGTEDPLLPVWQVDLGLMQSISAVRVFTAADTTQTRNDDLAVVIIDNNYSAVASNYTAVHPPVVALPGHDFPQNKQYTLYTFNPPVSGQFVQVAHTLTNAQYLVLPEVEVFKAYTTAPLISISRGPTNRTVDLNSTVDLSVSACVAGANINYLSYQWQSNGVDIVGANGATFSTPLLKDLGEFTFGVKLMLPGYSVTTQAVIEVFSDVVPPTVITNSFAARSAWKMTVNFSEALDPETATNTANYVFVGGATVSNPVLAANGKDVTFVVDGLAECDSYSLSITGIKDLAGNTIVATNLAGSLPAYLINYALDGTATESSNPYGYAAANAIDGNTGTLMHTGNADNEWWEVDLGAARMIGQVTLWFRNDCCFTRDNNLLVSILDNPVSRKAVWSGFIDTAPAMSPRMTNLVVAPAVSGQIVRVEHPAGVPDYLDFTEVQVVAPSPGFCIVQSPSDIAVVTNTAADFTVKVQGTGPFSYQWKHAGVDLAGATTSTLHIPVAGLAQAGSYTVEVKNPTRTHLSEPAVLTLVPPAAVNTFLLVNFAGTLSGTTYTLGSGEVDLTHSFAALAGTETINNGFAVLNSTAYGEGYSVTNAFIDGGSGVTTNFIAEMWFTPTAGLEQGTGQTGGYADIFSLGSIYFSENNHADGVIALRYTSPTNLELRVISAAGTADGAVTGIPIPLAGSSNHLAIVYRQGSGLTNNLLSYYLNGNLAAALPMAQNINSASAGSVIATFGQAVPGSSFAPRSLDGMLDSLAFSTFSGVFSPLHNFVLYTPPVAPVLTATVSSNGELTITWAAPGYVLEENTNLGNPGGWSNVAGGGSSPVVLQTVTGSRFYRLHKQ